MWADIGVIFPAFAMGLEFSFRKLLSVGGTAKIAAAVTIVAGMAVFVGYGTGMSLGFSHEAAFFPGGIYSDGRRRSSSTFDSQGCARTALHGGVVLGSSRGQGSGGHVLMVRFDAGREQAVREAPGCWAASSNWDALQSFLVAAGHLPHDPHSAQAAV